MLIVPPGEQHQKIVREQHRITGFSQWDKDQILINATQNYIYLIGGRDCLSENYKQYLLADLQDEYNKITKKISELTNGNQTT